MTNEQATNMLKAKLECLKRETICILMTRL